MKIFYQTKATATGGRSGHAQLDDVSLGFDLTPPDKGEGVNLEQLFALGYAACFDSALAFVAEKMGVTRQRRKHRLKLVLGKTMQADLA